MKDYIHKLYRFAKKVDTVWHLDLGNITRPAMIAWGQPPSKWSPHFRSKVVVMRETRWGYECG